MSSADVSDLMTGRHPGYALKRAQHALRTTMDRALRPLGLTSPQYAVLSAIELDPGISSAALARAAFVTPQTMQGIIANLERAGLLERNADPAHGRILKGELTKKGAKTLREAHAGVRKIEAIAFGSFSTAEIENLNTYLTTCAEALDREESASSGKKSAPKVLLRT
jgi:DNA-binding MarR family transcriptional regulator